MTETLIHDLSLQTTDSNGCSPFRTADIFCAVIDNFGDAGVCWRLAKRLRDLGLLVRLITDRPDVLSQLVPAIRERVAAGAAESCAEGIAVLDQTQFAALAAPQAADLIVETFACRLPENYERAIARRLEAREADPAADPRVPFYFNLDYLSAEAWVEDYHNIWGLHPTLPLKKLWFFPGFTDRTGGVLIEDDYLVREAAFLPQRADFLKGLACNPEHETLFFFAYPKNAVEAFAAGLLARKRPMNVLAAPGEAGDRLEKAIAAAGGAGAHLNVRRPGFFPQADFDKLLWASDILAIRGEDSFVRAQLAGKPLLWATYPTEDHGHRIKLDAWLERLAGVFACEADHALFARANREWLESDLTPETLGHFLDAAPAFAQAARRWRETLFTRGDLARRMIARAQSGENG